MNALQRDLKKLVPLVESLGAERVESDPHRQRFHVQPTVGWLNDPNGLCRIGDTYHVFYQYGPFDATGGVKHWGHVTSRDLMHWERQPVMLYPDEPFDCHGVYSGSAIVEDGTMYLLDTSAFKLHQLCDWRYLENENGKILRQTQGKPTYTATLVKYCDLICSRPNGQAKLTGIGATTTGA